MMSDVHDDISQESHQRLDLYESKWLSGDIPDTAAFVRNWQEDSAPQFLFRLIAFDLEQRWKHLDDALERSTRDRYGFPMFPKLEEYTSLLTPQQRVQLSLSELMELEYRIRCRCGDLPTREEYLQRFPQDDSAVNVALSRGADRECSISFDLPSSSSIVHQPTAIYDQDACIPEQGTEIRVGTPRQIGKYHVVKLIGRGGFGEVWKAFDPLLKREVAIKLLRRDREFPEHLIRTFKLESEKLARLGRIPGIVAIFDCGEFDGCPYLVSELIEGQTLSVRLKLEQFSYERAAGLIATVAESLWRSHLKDMVHRDVKPSNILLDQHDQPILIDFGLAISEQEQLQEERLRIGTLAYMSPEQARGRSHRVDGRADIYSLGVILYQMLTGRLPFVSNRSEEYLDQLLNRDPRPPRSIDEHIPHELERICLKCLSKRVSERYSTAKDLADELRRWISRNSDPGSNGRRQKYDRVVGGALLSVLLLMLVSTWFFFHKAELVDHSASPGQVPVDPEADGNLGAAESPSGDVFFADPPRAIVFDRSRTTNYWNWDEATHSLRLRSRDWALISGGTSNVANKILNSLIQSEQSASRFGFFWGLHEVDQLESDRIFTAMSLMIYAGQEFFEDQIQLATLTLRLDAENIFRIQREEVLLTIPRELGFQREWKIKLAFHESIPTELTLNEHRIDLSNVALDDLEGFEAISGGEIGIQTKDADLRMVKFYITHHE